ncbi:helicase-related protein [Cohnella phaseoli]|uniref:Helicase-like protein n=1 Tax=Cohnella phaseoli TaxID=456490 RepID=A0A3D9JPJ5_9BACL|nr:helicase-related protein [Cohnella phaseoli]RED75944.1 helicase-like protein [Cohnella phaseoli]
MAVLLSAPAITLPKWKSKELLKTVPDIEVNIIRSGNDALALLKRVRQGYKPKKLEFTLVGIDKAKLGSEIYFGGIWKRMYNVPLEDELGTFEYAWHCPGCGKPILVPLDEGDDKSELVPAPWDTFADVPMVSAQELEIARRQGELLPNGLPKGIKIKWKRHSKLPKFCEHSFPLTGVDATREGKEENPDRICGERLWRPAIHSLGESRNRSRVNISQVLKRLKGYFALYICDEAHMCKSEDSGRGDAFAQMVKSAKRTLMLTGTITNGKSTSIKELLWRTDPRSLLEAGVDYQTGSVEWASRFGKLEQVIKEEGGDEGVITRRNKRSVQTKEAPGIAPQLTAQFLLHKSAFLELPDLGLPLVELKEYPVFLDMDEGHGEHYTKFHNTLHEACKKASGASGTPGAWSKFNPATLMYSARPDQEMIVRLGQSAYTAPALGDGSMLHAKERWLVETVQSELSEGRRCIIFNQFTGSYNMNERVEEILQRMGVRCKILNEPNTELRTQRLAEYEAEEYPVIICAMKLVEVGLDMMYWPTIIYNQLSYEVSTVRQSSRRAWRIGQDRECRVYYPIYNRSQQMKQFMHIMSARGHALMVEGRLDKSELASFSIDSQSSLARDLASCFAGADVAKAWTTLAAKEMAGIEMIAEANFKDVLSERMQRLADETLKLCGIDPAQWHQERSKKPIIKEIGETRTIDLMNDLLIRQEVQAETSATTRILSNNVINLEEEIRILTFAELIVDEPRKILKKQIPTHENQLMWDFG